jgi:hypothetical protein
LTVVTTVPRVRRVLACAALLLLGVSSSAVARDPITPLSDIHRGLACTALTVVHGTTISSFDVEVLDVVADAKGRFAQILVRVSGPAVAASGVASGFSGSPVYCPAANGVVGNAGAISATVGQYGHDVALVTPIEQMLDIDPTPPTGVRRAPRLLRAARPLAAPLTISGLNPALGRMVERAASRSGRTVLAAPVGPLASFPPQPLVPGASLAVSLASGDLSMGAVGTVTYRDGATVYGFGHPLEGVGRRALLLQDAYVFAVIANPIDDGWSGSYKLAAPGHSLGTLTSDQSAGVVGTVGALPPTIPLSVRVRDEDRDRDVHLRSEIVDEVDIGNPSGGGFAPFLASIGVMEGAFLAVDGAPAEETGHLCLRARVREMREPLRFCNRYVVSGGSVTWPMANDVSTALGALDGARFAALHLTSASVSARIERGMRLATIVSAKGPRVVRPGKKLRLTLRVRHLRGPLRTLRVTTRVPRNLPPGPRSLRIIGTPPDGEGFSDDEDFGFLFFLFGGGGPRRPQSLREVRRRFEAVSRYDGVTAQLGKREWRLFRDERLRIDGRVSLDVLVFGKRRRGAFPGLRLGPPPR